MIGPDNPVSISVVARFLNASPDSEVLAFDNVRFQQLDESVPVRIDGLAIILCTEGRASITIDLTKYELRPNSLLIIQPNNFVRAMESSDDFHAHVVLCSVNTVQAILPKLTDMLPTLMQHRLMPVTNLTDNEAAGIKAFYQFIKLKIDGPKTNFQKHKVLSMLQAALYEMMDIRLTRDTAEGITHSRKEEIAARFILSVTENFRRERQVAYYAKQLCITPKHLSTVVRETTGRTAGEWIDSYVIMEAKMLLRTTDLTIQEITTRLNFTNQSFFGKYFKHHTGQSPTAFRLTHH
ncbi:MAG: AraC family transcriptional regulator [Bacteroidales bacterium]|nr:AraC family transcriptional regulator [Bacteroidales bacterium]